MTIIVHVLVIAFFVVGAYHTMDKGGIFEGVRVKLKFEMDRGFLSPLLAKPLGLCPFCMTSLYGSVVHWYLALALSEDLLMALMVWPIVIPSAAGIVFTIESIISNGHSSGDQGEHQEPGIGLSPE